MKIETQFSTIIRFTLDDGRVVEMKLCGREDRRNVLGKRYDEVQEQNRNDVAALAAALKK